MGVIFKKAFSQPHIFTAIVNDFFGIKLEIDKVETEKSFSALSLCPLQGDLQRHRLFLTQNLIIADSVWLMWMPRLITLHRRLMLII